MRKGRELLDRALTSLQYMQWIQLFISGSMQLAGLRRPLSHETE